MLLIKKNKVLTVKEIKNKVFDKSYYFSNTLSKFKRKQPKSCALTPPE